MTLTRRAALSTGLLVAGSAISGCSLLPGDEPTDAFPDPDEVKAQLRELTRTSGRDAFQTVEIRDDYTAATILLRDGSTQEYTRYTDEWRGRSTQEKSVLTSSASQPAKSLPIGRLPDYRRIADDNARGFTITVDHAGKIHVTARMPRSDDDHGLRVDGSARLPRLSIERPEDVRSMITEIIETYGRTAARVGSFNGFVHVDVNHPSSSAGLRVVRHPNLPPKTSVTEERPFADNLLFDASGFDPTIALRRKKSIAAEANIEGKVWSWAYRRPEPGAEPLVSYGIGESGPAQRVWIDAKGSVLHVEAGRCTPGSAWCPS